jgi:hypothetical protein
MQPTAQKTPLLTILLLRLYSLASDCLLVWWRKSFLLCLCYHRMTSPAKLSQHVITGIHIYVPHFSTLPIFELFSLQGDILRQRMQSSLPRSKRNFFNCWVMLLHTSLNSDSDPKDLYLLVPPKSRRLKIMTELSNIPVISCERFEECLCGWVYETGTLVINTCVIRA